MTNRTATQYTQSFYSGQASGSLRSARKVAPLILQLMQVNSVVDVGGGVGPWVRAFLDLGVERGLCVDGDYVDRTSLLIAEEQFLSRDLSKPLNLGESFDLAICVEVAEHLPPTDAEALVAELILTAPAVLFSAAIPNQGGVDHRNERWQSYWQSLFASHDFIPLDVVRVQVWNDTDVVPWYAQNTLLYIRSADRHNYVQSPMTTCPIDVVNPRFYEYQRNFIDNPAVVDATRALVLSLRHEVRTIIQRMVTRITSGRLGRTGR